MDSYTAQIDVTKAARVREKLAAYFELTKPRIAFLLVLTSACGFYLGTRGSFNIPLFVNAMLGITLLAFGVATLNQFVERDIDPRMERTANRPLPSHRISPAEALVFGLLQCAAAEVYLLVLVNPLTAVLGLIVIIGYVLVYTPLKTHTSVCTAIGAIPGALPPLMGWTAAANDITLAAWALFVIQFLWQFPHFLSIAWMYRDQYRAAGIKMLPAVEPDGHITFRQIVLFTIMLIPVSLAPFFFANAGFIFLVGACLLGSWFLWASVRAARTKSNAAARGLLLVSVFYLPILFLLMVIDKR